MGRTSLTTVLDRLKISYLHLAVENHARSRNTRFTSRWERTQELFSETKGGRASGGCDFGQGVLNLATDGVKSHD